LDSNFDGVDPELEAALLTSLEEGSDPGSGLGPAPQELLIFPILRRPFFPGMAAPLVIEAGPYYDALKIAAKTKHKCLGLLLTKSEDADIYEVGLKELYAVGVMARILRIIPTESGGAQVILSMDRRIKVTGPGRRKRLLAARVTYHDDHVKLTKELKAYAIAIISTIKELLKLNPLFKEELQIFLGHSDFTEPGRLADFAVALTTATRQELQKVLETFQIEKRIDKALILLKKELDISELQNRISQRIDASISKTQREFFLREQLKTIRKELGMDRDEKGLDLEKFQARIKERTLPKDVESVISEELDKISTLDVQSSEYGIARGYLDWLTIVPWGVHSKDRLDVRKAKTTLDEDHYGLDDIKKRILEFISVGKLTGGVRGSIICLVGPPGVGKTSIGKSVARALNRKFYRFSVGGMRDEAEIKGHRRTYIGAMPGKMIQALKYCGTANPVIMLDEVDKMGQSFQGDPASALLEVLDPEQNKDFLDHYLDVRCDLSNVIFIVTANVLDTIPEPLQDRMDIMRLSGYVMQEKLEIAKRYLTPRNRKEMGLKAKQVDFTRTAMRTIINQYAREAGVRSLEGFIKKILRKAAFQIVQADQRDRRSKKLKAEEPVEHHYHITPKNLSEYIGQPIFISDRFYKTTPIGVATGLAWTSLGGATLYVETTRVPAEKTSMRLTGQAGDVMKESAQIAWTYCHYAMKSYCLKCAFFKESEVHIHIPEGATPKDGPSAGVTMVTALLSLLMNEKILDDLGMTGELTLTGRVLPVGGIKEKVIAARRSGLKTLIIPKENKRDYQELPGYIKQGIKVLYADHYDDVFKVAFQKKRRTKK
jgi:ATP-dependent Lon protease